jgi:2-octaprenyl-6-methoxyphenol hydroxylase
MTARPAPEAFDIAIVGGGMVGASLGVALAPLGLRIALIEAIPHDSGASPSFDERTTALSNGSRQILETLGVWPEVGPSATPIAKIHISDQGRFGFARIDAAEQGLAALGFVVPNRELGRALWPRLAASAHVRVYWTAGRLRSRSQMPASPSRPNSSSPPMARGRRCAAPSESMRKCATTNRLR